MRRLMKPAIIALAPLLVIGCEANGGFPGEGGGGGGGGADNGLMPGDTVPADFVCAAYGSGTVTTSEGGGGCELEAVLGAATEVCDIVDPELAGDGDPETFATVVVAGSGLDPIIGFGDFQTDLSLTVQFDSTISPSGNQIAGFDIEIPGFAAEISVLETIVVETLLDGTPTGESVDAAPPADVGGGIFSGRYIAGFVPAQPFNQVRISFGGSLIVDLDDHAYVYDACLAAEPPPAA